MSETIKKEKGHFRRNWPFYTLLILALGGSGFLWVSKTMALSKQTKAFELEKTTIITQAQEGFRSNSEKNLDLMMKAFVWAVRGEMTRGNQEQVDQYFKQLVKSDKVEEVTLVDKDGVILISTNKKNEGNKLAEEFANAVMKVEETTIIDKLDKQVIAAPLLSLDSRMGTLMVVYKPDVFQLEEKVDLAEK